MKSPEQSLRHDITGFNEAKEWRFISSPLGLNEQQWKSLSEEDRGDLIDFYTQANADMVRLFQKQNPDQALSRPAIEGNMLRPHDWVHYVERLKMGPSVFEAPSFMTQPANQRYFDHETVIQELYPSIFLSSGLNMNRAMALQVPKQREVSISIIESDLEPLLEDYPDHQAIPYYQARIDLLRQPISTSREGRMYTFEQNLKYELLALAARAFPHATAEELAVISNAFDALNNETRPSGYLEFASRVFDLEYVDNPRLFVDEVLSVIRKQR